MSDSRIDTTVSIGWDSVPETGSADLDPLAILVASEDDEDDDDTTTEGNTMSNTTDTTNPFADANDVESFDAAAAKVDVEQRIEEQEAEVKQIEQDLLKVRECGKEQWILKNSATANYRERKTAEARVVELQVEMAQLAKLLDAGNAKLRQLHIERMLQSVAKLEIPTDDNAIGQRAAATFLTGGLNGVNTSLHYLDGRKAKLEELCERDRKRGNVAGKVYRDYQDDLEDLNALVEQLSLIVEWSLPVCNEALATMQTNEYYNPSLRNPAERYGNPVDNATPFD